MHRLNHRGSEEARTSLGPQQGAVGLGVELDLGFSIHSYIHSAPLAEWTMAHFHLLPLETGSAQDTQGAPAPQECHSF